LKASDNCRRVKGSEGNFSSIRLVGVLEGAAPKSRLKKRGEKGRGKKKGPKTTQNFAFFSPAIKKQGKGKRGPERIPE